MDYTGQSLQGVTLLLALSLLMASCASVAGGSRALVDTTASAAELTSVLMGNMKSPLSKFEANSYAALYKRTGSVGNLCQSGHLYCDAQAYEAFYEKLLQPEEAVEETDIAVFFRESELMVGHQVTIVDQRLQFAAMEHNRQALDRPVAAGFAYAYINVNKLPERAFLPAELAQTLFLGGDSAAKTFRLDGSSNLAKESRKTVALCNDAIHKDGTTALEGEVAGCASSLEALQNLLQRPTLLGSNRAVEALTTEASLLQGSVTGEVVEVRMKASEKSRHAVCHNLMYPSAVYFCHYLANTRVYAVTLQAGPAKEALQGVAMCHLDTSGWNPRHLAFQNLATVPGQSEACHWVLQGSLTFVPAA